MIIKRTPAKKSLAVIVALALFASAPMSAWSQTQFAASRAASGNGLLGGVGAIGAYTPGMVAVTASVVLPNLSLKSPTFVPNAVSLLQPAAERVAAQPLAVEAHPVIGLLNALQAKGVVLPETLSTRQDAAQLRIAAEALPEGSARQNMIVMANAISAANGAGGGQAFDGGAAKPAAVPAGRRGSPSSPAVREVAEKPANPADLEVGVQDLRFVPAPARLPESTAKIAAVDSQIVGQANALEAIQFGLQMRGDHYNLFVSGPEGSGRETALRHILPGVAASMPTPNDLVAATNFADKDNPVILEVPAGRGVFFTKMIKKFVAALEQILPEQLESGEIGAAKRQIITRLQEAAAQRKESFQAEVKTITLAGGVFTVEFLADSSGEGRMTIGLALMHGGKMVDPEKVDELIASGAFTRDQFEAAQKERNQKFPAVVEKFKAMMAQNNKEMEAAQEQIAQLEKRAVESIILSVARPLLAAVVPEPKASPEMAALEEEYQAWSADFNARVSAVDVEGFGVVFMTNGGDLSVAFTKDGQPLDRAVVAELMKKGLTTAKFAEIQAALSKAVKPLLTEFKAKDQEFGAREKTLAQSQPKAVLTEEQLKAASYVQTLLKVAIANHHIFMGKSAASDEDGEEAPGQKPPDAEDFFVATALSDNRETKGAPVVWVKNPTYDTLFGEADDNRRTTLIPGLGVMKGGAPGGPSLKGGLIHKANGGFIVIDAMDALREPGVWQALMAVARNGEAEIVEDGVRGLMLGKGATHHVPAKVKIVLIGSPSLRMLLAQHDPIFETNFQSLAEFEPTMPASEESLAGYVQFFKNSVVKIAADLKQEGKDLTAGAMSALIEQGARFCDSNKKLTAQFGALYGLIREATFSAQGAGHSEVGREDVDAALKAKENREEVYGRRMREYYEAGVFKVLTSGAVVGQVNGLAVQGRLGILARVTASAFAGKKGVLAIDQVANLLGRSAIKATASIGGALAAEVGGNLMQKVEIHIAFEQTYGGLDGDSASQTEYIASLSALSGVPIKQNLAITGSLDQLINTQAIGGANEKIEGFFALCKHRGLTGDQGVIIPRTNVADLQLSPEIVQAVREGKFHIYAVDNVRQAAELLTGVSYKALIEKARAGAKALAKGN